MTERTWSWIDPDGIHTMTESEIIAEYYPYWRQQMLRKNPQFTDTDLDRERAIQDFVVVHWAYQETP